MKTRILSILPKTIHHLFLLFLMLNGSDAFAQMPQGVPHPGNNSPIDFTSASDIILYIVLPVVLVVAYVILRRRKLKKRQKGQQNSPGDGQ